MRFFALQTDIHWFRKQLVLENEEELLVTRRHALVFFLPATIGMIIWALVLYLLAEIAPLLDSEGAGKTIGWIAIIATVIFLFALEKAWIDWRYNFLIVTAQKVVVIIQSFVFYQHVNPIPLEKIAGVTSESQLLGIWHCGVLRISVLGQKVGSTQTFGVTYVPKAEVVVGIIENAMSLRAEKAKDETPAEQAAPLQEVQQKAQTEEIPTPESAAAPPRKVA